MLQSKLNINKLKYKNKGIIYNKNFKIYMKQDI